MEGSLGHMIDKIEDPEQWVAEHELPPASQDGANELLIWVADIDEKVEALPPSDEKIQELREKRDLIMYVLSCAFADEEGGRSERFDYFKIALRAIKNKRTRERAEAVSSH